MTKKSAYKFGAEIKKVVEEIRRAQAESPSFRFSLHMRCSFEELHALRKHVDGFLVEKHTEADHVLLDAMEALASAMPRLNRD